MTVLKTYDLDQIASERDGWRTTDTQVVIGSDGQELRWSKTKASLIFAARRVLNEENPMTVRQVYYALFSRGWVDNSESSYRQVVGALKDARQAGLVPWEHIEDRTRKPRGVQMHDDLAGFLDTVRKAYRRNVWQNQPVYVEVWLEKDALSGIFESELRSWGVTLNVGKGYDGWASIQEAADRFQQAEARGQTVHVLYAGDYDPSGLHMEVSLRERLAFFGVRPTWSRMAIDREDIDEYGLPEEPGKRTDSRSDWMVDRYGELIQVELDAMPVDVLRNRINETIRERLDLDRFDETRARQRSEREDLASIIEEWEDD